jgi:hypothetical protein
MGQGVLITIICMKGEEERRKGRPLLIIHRPAPQASFDFFPKEA